VICSDDSTMPTHGQPFHDPTPGVGAECRAAPPY